MWYINWAEETRVRLVCGHSDQVMGAATTSDGMQLATCCRDGTVAVWNMENLEQTVVFQTPKKVSSYNHTFVMCTVFSSVLGMFVYCLLSTSFKNTSTCDSIQ